jgi:hypothetical protein
MVFGDDVAIDAINELYIRFYICSRNHIIE